MKKVISLLLIALSIVMLASCSGDTEKNAELQSGVYILENDVTGPYVSFDTENLTWHCGAGLAISYSLGGTYTQIGDRIEAKNKDGTETVLEFQILSESEIKAITVKEGFFPQESEWISEGEIYIIIE